MEKGPIYDLFDFLPADKPPPLLGAHILKEYYILLVLASAMRGCNLSKNLSVVLPVSIEPKAYRGKLARHPARVVPLGGWCWMRCPRHAPMRGTAGRGISKCSKILCIGITSVT